MIAGQGELDAAIRRRAARAGVLSEVCGLGHVMARDNPAKPAESEWVPRRRVSASLPAEVCGRRTRGYVDQASKSGSSRNYPETVPLGSSSDLK